MNKNFVPTAIIASIITIMLFLFAKPVLIALILISISWFWPRLRFKYSLNVLFLQNFNIDFLLFGSIIMGYFYGPFFGVFTPLLMGIIEAFHSPISIFGTGKYLFVHMIIGLLASVFSTISFGVAAITILILGYAIDYFIDFLKGTFNLRGLPNDLFNFALFSMLFFNYEKGFETIFRER